MLRPISICNSAEVSNFQNQSGVHCSCSSWAHTPPHNQQWTLLESKAGLVVQTWPGSLKAMFTEATITIDMLVKTKVCITTPSKQGPPTGRAPSCQEQGRVSQPRSHWSKFSLLASDWSRHTPGWDGLEGWDGWTRAQEGVCSRVGALGQVMHAMLIEQHLS